MEHERGESNKNTQPINKCNLLKQIKKNQQKEHSQNKTNKRENSDVGNYEIKEDKTKQVVVKEKSE